MKNNKPLISIITVVYNGAGTIERTIRSIKDQDYDNIEYLIVDGGSTDNTLSVVRSFGDTISKCISEKDNGIYDAMNKGIALANGELIGMINSDDWYEKDAVSHVVEAFNANPTKKIFHGDRYDVDTSGSRVYYPFKANKFKFFVSSMIYNHPSFFVHRSVYENQVYDTELKVYADYHFTLYHYLNYPQYFHYIPVAYANYSLDGYSSTYSLYQNIKRGNLGEKKGWFAFLDHMAQCFSKSGFKNKEVFKREVFKKMKRILFLLHLPPPVHGASTVAKYIHDSAYINNQFDTDYISIGLNPKIGNPSLKEGIFKFIKLFATVNRRLFSRKYDLIYFTMTAKGKAFLKDAFFIIWLNLIGYKVVTHLHNKGVSESKNQVLKALYRWVFKKNHTIQLSERLFNDISEYAPPEKVYFCPNGVEDVGAKPSVSNLKKYDFLFLSNLIESKGILIFMEACRLLANSNHTFKVAVVGSDGDVDQDYLNEFVARNKLKKFITVLGPKFGDAKSEVFQESKVFVFPTFYHYECFPLVLLEAMSNAMPLISTNEGAILDILDHGVNGLLVDKENAVNLSEAMREFLMEPGKGKTMGLNSRKKYEQEFTREIFERNMTNILNKIVL